MNQNTTQRLTPSPNLRWKMKSELEGEAMVLQQEHQILEYREVSDGFGGGETWMRHVPSGKFKWVDVPIVHQSASDRREE